MFQYVCKEILNSLFFSFRLSCSTPFHVLNNSQTLLYNYACTFIFLFLSFVKKYILDSISLEEYEKG